jgi:hypothetical protein
MVDLVVELGEQVGDRIVLKRKDLEAHIAEIDRKEKASRLKSLKLASPGSSYSRQVALKVLDKGGLVVVAEDGHLITTYHYGTNKRH